jgi:DNA-binding transcriptional ArsR family regulator
MRPGEDSDSSVRALAHPLRARIVAIMAGREMTAGQLAAELNASVAAVLHHAAILQECGFLVALAGEPTRYAVPPETDLLDHEWARSSTTVKRVGAGTTLQQVHAATIAALAEGGFDRADMHLSRTSLDLDEEGWRELATEMLGWLERLDDIRGRAATRIADGERSHVAATAVLMLFETAVAFRSPGPALEDLLDEWVREKGA